MIDRRVRSTASRSVLPSDNAGILLPGGQAKPHGLTQANQQEAEDRQGDQDLQQGEPDRCVASSRPPTCSVSSRTCRRASPSAQPTQTLMP